MTLSTGRISLDSVKHILFCFFLWHSIKTVKVKLLFQLEAETGAQGYGSSQL